MLLSMAPTRRQHPPSETKWQSCAARGEIDAGAYYPACEAGADVEGIEARRHAVGRGHRAQVDGGLTLPNRRLGRFPPSRGILSESPFYFLCLWGLLFNAPPPARYSQGVF